MFINVNLGSEVQEQEPRPEGRYVIRIINVQPKESKGSGAPMLQIMHEIDGDPKAAPIFHYIVLPTENDEEKTVNFKLLQMKRYLHMTGIPFAADGFNQEDLMGAEFEANLTFNTGVNDEGAQEYPPSNSIQVDRMPREAE